MHIIQSRCFFYGYSSFHFFEKTDFRLLFFTQNRNYRYYLGNFFLFCIWFGDHLRTFFGDEKCNT